MANDIIPEKTVEKKKRDRRENQLDRRQISERSREDIQQALETIEDADTRQALMEIAHILTGDDRFEK